MTDYVAAGAMIRSVICEKSVDLFHRYLLKLIMIMSYFVVIGAGYTLGKFLYSGEADDYNSSN